MKKWLVIVSALVVLPAAAASADTIRYQGTGLGVTGFSASYSNGTITRAYGYFAGQLRFTGLNGSPDQFTAYCLDFMDFLNTSQEMTVRNIGQFPGGGDAPPQAQAATGEKIGYLLSKYAAVVTSPEQAAALQFAIWEVVLDTPGSYALDSGLFKVTSLASSVSGLAATYLTNIGSSTSGTWLDVVDRNGYGQDFAIPQPVPEPASLALLGTGLFGLAAGLRRSLRKG